MEDNEWKPYPTIEQLFAASSSNNTWSSINSPTAGARTQKDLPVGTAPFQLYSLGTPNGQKVGILLEELGIEYDAHVVNIMNGDQFTSGFVDVNPNSKIPAAVDHSTKDSQGNPIKLFESGSIMLYLADKYKKFIPSDFALRTQVLNWVFWQMAGQGPMTGNFGHFFVYAPPDKKEARDYGAARYGMETQRLLSVLDTHLKGKTYLVNEEYTIADMIILPWVQQTRNGYKHKSGVGAADFLGVSKYTNVIAWADRIAERPAVKRGLTVCTGGKGKPWLEEVKN